MLYITKYINIDTGETLTPEFIQGNQILIIKTIKHETFEHVS